LATKFYPDPTNAPSVSPAFGCGASVWDDTTGMERKKLNITKGNNGSVNFEKSETDTTKDLRYGMVQFVSEPLDAITWNHNNVLSSFRMMEDNSGANFDMVVAMAYCDADGSNVTYLEDEQCTSEATTTLSELGNFETDMALAPDFPQGKRLIVEIGFSAGNTKSTPYTFTFCVTDNSGTDLTWGGSESAAYNSWIQFDETITEAAPSGTDYFWPPEGDNEGGGSNLSSGDVDSRLSERSGGRNPLISVVGAFVAAATIAFSPMPPAGANVAFQAEAGYGKHVYEVGSVSGDFSAVADYVYNLAARETGDAYATVDASSDLETHREPIADVPALFGAGADVVSALNISVTGDVQGTFSTLSDIGSEIAPEVGADGVFSAEGLPGIGRTPDISGATGVFDASHDFLFDLGPDVGANWAISGGVSSVVLEVDSLGPDSVLSAGADVVADLAAGTDYTPDTEGAVEVYTADHSFGYGRTYEGTNAGSFTTDYDLGVGYGPSVFVDGVFSSEADVLAELVAGIDYTPDTEGAVEVVSASSDIGIGHLPDAIITGDLSAGADITASLVSGDYVPTLDGATWVSSGGVSTIVLEVDSLGPDAVFSGTGDVTWYDDTKTYTVDGSIGLNFTHPAEYWVAITREPAPTVIGVAAASVTTPNIYVDAIYEGLASVVFRSGADIAATGTQTVTHSGDVSGSFAATKDVGIGYASEVTGAFSGGSDIVAAAATSRIVDVGVAGRFSAGHVAYVQIADAVEVGNVSWGLSGGVSTAVIEVDAVGAFVPAGSFSAGADYVRSSVWVSPQLSGSVVGHFSGGSEYLVTSTEWTVVLDGSVAYFTDIREKYYYGDGARTTPPTNGADTEPTQDGAYSDELDSLYYPIYQGSWAVSQGISCSAIADVGIGYTGDVSCGFSVGTEYARNIVQTTLTGNVSGAWSVASSKYADLIYTPEFIQLLRLYIATDELHSATMTAVISGDVTAYFPCLYEYQDGCRTEVPANGAYTEPTQDGAWCDLVPAKYSPIYSGYWQTSHDIRLTGSHDGVYQFVPRPPTTIYDTTWLCEGLPTSNYACPTLADVIYTCGEVVDESTSDDSAPGDSYTVASKPSTTFSDEGPPAGN
jgi:hypothetical protein